MAPTRYGDLSKKANSLLTDDYNFDRKFKLTTKSTSGITFTTEGVLTPKKVDGKFSAKFVPVEGVSVDKLQITSAGRIVAEGTLKGYVKGTDFIVKVQDGAGKPPNGELEIKYSAPKFTVDTVVDVVQGPSLAVSGTVAPVDKWVLGGTVKYNTNYDQKKDPVVEDYGFALSHLAGDATVTLATKKKLTQFQGSVHVDVNKDTQVAVQCDASLSKDGKLGGLSNVTLTLGGIVNLDADKVQAKIDSNGLVSANYHVNIRPGLKGIASAQLDALNFVGDSHKLGLALVLG